MSSQISCSDGAINQQWVAACSECDIQLLVLDFDGVLTDNRVLIDENGIEAVMCHRGDSLGIDKVKKMGFDVIVLSTETSSVVLARCRKLCIDCVHGCDDKLPRLKSLVSERGLDAENVAYVGNDANDAECLSWVGLPIAVNDSDPSAISVAKYVTERNGGHGAVREVCDLLLKSFRKA